MHCPKCNGGAFLSDEELVKHIEGQEPHRVIIKATHTCMSCQEKFSRLVWDELGPHRRHAPGQMPYQHPQAQQQYQQQYQQAPNPYQYPQQAQQSRKQDDEVVDGLKFF